MSLTVRRSADAYCVSVCSVYNASIAGASMEFVVPRKTPPPVNIAITKAPAILPRIPPFFNLAVSLPLPVKNPPSLFAPPLSEPVKADSSALRKEFKAN